MGSQTHLKYWCGHPSCTSLSRKCNILKICIFHCQCNFVHFPEGDRLSFLLSSCAHLPLYRRFCYSDHFFICYGFYHAISKSYSVRTPVVSSASSNLLPQKTDLGTPQWTRSSTFGIWAPIPKATVENKHLSSCHCF